MAPDPFVAPYHSFLLERTPKPQPKDPRAWRKDEYPEKGQRSELELRLIASVGSRPDVGPEKPDGSAERRLSDAPNRDESPDWQPIPHAGEYASCGDVVEEGDGPWSVKAAGSTRVSWAGTFPRMRQVVVSVPEDRLGELYEAVATLNKPGEEPSPRPPQRDWDGEVAALALNGMTDHEKILLWRVADARGRRIPVSELSRDLGLPAATAPEHDFSRLSAFCADPGNPLMPVIAGGSDCDGWYWMSTRDARVFRGALKAAFTGEPAPPVAATAETGAGGTARQG